MQIIVDERITHYIRVGSGPSVLILHGWADSVANWRSFIDQMSHTYDVMALDLPGFGATEAPGTAWGLDEYAQFVRAFLDKIGVQPDILIGHSNGGAIAIRGLAGGVLEAESLVLIASAGVRARQRGRKMLLKLAAKTGNALTLPLPDKVRKRIRNSFYTKIGSDLLIAEHMQATFKKVVAADIVQDATRLSLPTLLIYGDQDTATPIAYGQLLHESIPGSTLEIIGGAGHFIYLEQPAAVIKQVEAFRAGI